MTGQAIVEIYEVSGNSVSITEVAPTIVEVGNITRIELSYKVETFIADAAMLNDRAVTLSQEPLEPLSVELVIYGGVEQRSGVDFQVSGRIVSWSQLALETLLEVGTAFSIRYVSR